VGGYRVEVVVESKIVKPCWLSSANRCKVRAERSLNYWWVHPAGQFLVLPPRHGEENPLLPTDNSPWLTGNMFNAAEENSSSWRSRFDGQGKISAFDNAPSLPLLQL